MRTLKNMCIHLYMDFPGGTSGKKTNKQTNKNTQKNSPASAGDMTPRLNL